MQSHESGSFEEVELSLAILDWAWAWDRTCGLSYDVIGRLVDVVT